MIKTDSGPTIYRGNATVVIAGANVKQAMGSVPLPLDHHKELARAKSWVEFESLLAKRMDAKVQVTGAKDAYEQYRQDKYLVPCRGGPLQPRIVEGVHLKVVQDVTPLEHPGFPDSLREDFSEVLLDEPETQDMLLILLKTLWYGKYRIVYKGEGLIDELSKPHQYQQPINLKEGLIPSTHSSTKYKELPFLEWLLHHLRPGLKGKAGLAVDENIPEVMYQQYILETEGATTTEKPPHTRATLTTAVNALHAYYYYKWLNGRGHTEELGKEYFGIARHYSASNKAIERGLSLVK